MNPRKFLLSVSLLTLLAACGGGYNDDQPVVTADGTKVPASALASATAYSQWAASLMNSETGAAVTVDDGLMPPKSESDEPIGVR